MDAVKARYPDLPMIDVVNEAVPGIIEAENFDKGGEESTFHDKDATDQGGTSYRTDNEGLDIITTPDGGYAVGNHHTQGV